MTQGPQWLPAHDDDHGTQDEHSADHNHSFNNEQRLNDDHSAYNMHDEQGAHNEDNTHRWLLLTINMVCMMTTMPTNNMVATVTMVSFMNVPPYNDHGGKRCLQCPRRWECPQWPWYGAHHAQDWGTHKKQWHVWPVAHSQLCLKNKSTHEIPNKKTIQYLSIIYK